MNSSWLQTGRKQQPFQHGDKRHPAAAETTNAFTWNRGNEHQNKVGRQFVAELLCNTDQHDVRPQGRIWPLLSPTISFPFIHPLCTSLLLSLFLPPWFPTVLSFSPSLPDISFFSVIWSIILTQSFFSPSLCPHFCLYYSSLTHPNNVPALFFLSACLSIYPLLWIYLPLSFGVPLAFSTVQPASTCGCAVSAGQQQLNKHTLAHGDCTRVAQLQHHACCCRAFNRRDELWTTFIDSDEKWKKKVIIIRWPAGTQCCDQTGSGEMEHVDVFWSTPWIYSNCSVRLLNRTFVLPWKSCK